MIRRWAWPVMGSMASLAIPGTVDQRLAERAARQVRTRLAEAEARFSPFRPDNELCRSWRAESGPGEPSEPMREVIAAVEHLRNETGGAFHPVDRSGHFDPTGYVKGWAIQRAVEQVLAMGVGDVCLGIGGDIQAVGTAGQDRTGIEQPWRVAVVDPADARRIVAVVSADGPMAVATSGNAERGEHIWDGEPWSGLARLDGRTRAPADRRNRGPASITVVGPELRLADAYATAIWAGALRTGLDDAWAWLGGTGYEALAVQTGGSIRATAGMADLLVRPAA